MRGTIRQRGENTWQLLYRLGTKQTGETVHGTKKEAEARLAQIMAELGKGEFVSPGKVTTGAYLLSWLENVQPTVRPKTYYFYRGICNNHLIPGLGHLKLADLRAAHIQALYRKLSEKLSPGGVACVHRTLKVALNSAIKQRIISRGADPLEGVKLPKIEEKEPTILTPEQALQFLEASKYTGRRSLYLAAILTGMRQGELLGLRWADVDLVRGIIRVRQQATGSGKNTGFAPPKSAAGRRLVSIPDSLLDALKAERELADALEKTAALGTRGAENPHDLVWHVAGGGPINSRNLDNQFKQILDKAKLPDMKFHELRNTHATWLHLVNADPLTRQKRLGHSSLDMTRHYTALSQVPEVDRKVAADIDALINPGRQDVDKAEGDGTE